MATYLSGIQPSGTLHLGNYFGAIRQHIALQEREGEHFYFIADYHALTTLRDAKIMRENVMDVAVSYLALGLDPSKVALFRQSDVPEVTEIAWLLSTVTGMGLLERAHSYKDKLAKGMKPSVGLFSYPILMAADILAYGSTVVPVGKDQVQHVEMTQDMATHFNTAFDTEVFVRPEWEMASTEAAQKVPGLDGEKMSKSYGNTIPIFLDGKPLKKLVNRIVTDSRPPEEPKNPDELFVFDLLALFLEKEELEDWKAQVKKGGEDAPGYGHLKARVREAMEAFFADARAKRVSLLGDLDYVEDVLVQGAQAARQRAQGIRDRALKACGLR